MTKLDGTAKGGILIKVVQMFHFPVYGIGVGEKSADFQSFDGQFFAKGIMDL